MRNRMVVFALAGLFTALAVTEPAHAQRWRRGRYYGNNWGPTVNYGDGWAYGSSWGYPSNYSYSPGWSEGYVNPGYTYSYPTYSAPTNTYAAPGTTTYQPAPTTTYQPVPTNTVDGTVPPEGSDPSFYTPVARNR